MITNPIFQQKISENTSFNLVSQANPFNSIFDTQLLDDKTVNALDRLMHELVTPGTDNAERVREDLIKLKALTVEVKAIEKQGVLLIGERLFKARELIGKYERGTDGFKAWLNIAFKHRSSAYNILAYYELYKTLPTPELQKRLKEMPHKAAYILAARKGELEQKAEIINKYCDMRADEIIAIVQTQFPPLFKKEPKQSAPDALIDTIRMSLRKLIAKKRSLKETHLAAIADCQNLLKALLETNPSTDPPIEVSPQSETI